jgi:hypothetical protein
MKQQTAIEYYINSIMALDIARGLNNMKIDDYLELKKTITLNAIEMHKDQIIDAVDGFPLTYRYMSGTEYYQEVYGE